MFRTKVRLSRAATSRGIVGIYLAQIPGQGRRADGRESSVVSALELVAM
jgi:hypothetical protein